MINGREIYFFRISSKSLKDRRKYFNPLSVSNLKIYRLGPVKESSCSRNGRVLFKSANDPLDLFLIRPPIKSRSS